MAEQPVEETHVKEIPLENNLRTHIYDASRRQAGDRWLVKLIARTHVKVDDAFSQNDPGIPAKSAVKELMGDSLVFEQNKTRRFIDEREKDRIFQSMLEDFLAHTVPYLSHPEFARRYVLKEFQAKQKQQTRQPAP